MSAGLHVTATPVTGDDCTVRVMAAGRSVRVTRTLSSSMSRALPVVERSLNVSVVVLLFAVKFAVLVDQFMRPLLMPASENTWVSRLPVPVAATSILWLLVLNESTPMSKVTA